MFARISIADQFDALEGPVLSRYVTDHASESVRSITMNELSALPGLLEETRSPLLVIKTAEGNYARILLVPALRKPSSGMGSPFSILVLERFDVFDASNKRTRLSKGRDMMLFDGFEVDLDSGQIVPAGEGGDLRFVATKGQVPRLEAVGMTRLFAPKSLPVRDSQSPPQPSPGRRVLPSDFAGKYRLFSNGQLSGLMELRVEDNSVIIGSFRSDAQGSVYEITGLVVRDNPQRIRFTIKFPRSTQEFEGYLWADGKGAMAGTATLLERTVGFFAVREGGRVAPVGVDVAEMDRSIPTTEARISMTKDSIKISNREIPTGEIGSALKKLGREQLLMEVAPGTPYERVDEVLKQARVAGFATIRLGLGSTGDQK